MHDFKLTVTGPQTDSAHLISEWFLAPVFACVREPPCPQEFILPSLVCQIDGLQLGKSTPNAAQGPEADNQASTDSSLVAFSECFLSSASHTPSPIA